MKDIEYRKWIEAGYRDYGKDPWFFIRELAQNSRDASARTIQVKAGHTNENNEILIFEDDGNGMTYAHALRYLFRLYASSKTNEKHSAGIFGIGFWTVLKFNPSRIIIESSFKKEKWGVIVDSDLKTTKTASNLAKSGTRITLIRRRTEKTLDDFVKQIEHALVRYCSYMRRNNPNAEPLPVLFAGKNITRQMNLPGPVSLKFKKGTVEGVVGLDRRPHVNLYARGLPVWQGTTLEELSHTPPCQSHQHDIAQGLAPIFLVNGNNLEVNISRRKVIDNRALQNVRKTAEKALSQLVEMAADSVSPRSIFQRFSDRFKQTTTSILSSFWKSLIVSVIIILPLEYALLNTFFKEGMAPPTFLSMQVSNNCYSGASVKAISSRSTVNISYYPPIISWFKLFHAEEYQQASGFTQAFTSSNTLPFPPMNCHQKDIFIELKTREKGTLLLPQPISHSIDPGSITLNSVSISSTGYYSTGGVVITIPRNGVIRYRCCPIGKRENLTPAVIERLTNLPQNLSIPSSMQRNLIESMKLSTDKKLGIALRLTTSLLKYDDSEGVAEKYRDSSTSDWFQKVTDIGAGDCDILNGVNIIFLRKMRIPARLVIGLIGEKGKILPGMHAWTEYFDNGWHTFDATLSTAITRERGTATPIPHSVQKYPVITNTIDRYNKKTETLPIKNNDNTIHFLVYGALFTLLLLFVFLILNRKQQENPFQSRDIEQVKENLAGMALHALLHPNAWGDDSNIRYVKIIPTISSRSISLKEALILSKKRKLFYISKTNPLIKNLQKSSIPIAETGNPPFDSLIKLLPGAVNLDRITRLRVKTPGTGDHSPLDRLLTAVNRFPAPPCLSAPGLLKGDFFDVDLSLLPSFSGPGIPYRFIAVNPNSNRIESLASLFQQNPHLAQFKLLKALLKESTLIAYPAEYVIRKVCRHLIKEIS